MYVLFLTEMWERFSYYGLRALLIFYLTSHFRYPDSDAFVIYGSFTALIFVVPVLGGYIADHYLGYRKAVIFGGILMICGHAGMAFEGTAASVVVSADGVEGAQRDEIALQLLYLSLSLLIAGVGFLKPNVTTLLGRLYPDSGHQREIGFIAFYVGITTGGSLAAFVCGYLAIEYGWKYGFGAAGLGMCIGLGVFVCGRRHLQGLGEPPDATFRQAWVIYLLCLLGVLGIWQLIQVGRLSGYLILTLFAIGTCGMAVYAFMRFGRVGRRNTLTVILVAAISALFSVYVTQSSITINLFTLRHVNLEIFGLSLKAPQVQGLSGVFVILMGPLVMWLTSLLGRRNVDVSMYAKMGAAFVAVGVGFLALTYGTTQADEAHRISLIFVALLFWCWAVADNLLLPTSFSAAARYAPAQISGLMMGLYMMAFSVGYFGASTVAQWAAVSGAGAADASSDATLTMYRDFFAVLGATAVLFGVAIWAGPWLGRTRAVLKQNEHVV
jgi:POT family proton-dependent oligopeptide transporter